jgi:hypothetical protein
MLGCQETYSKQGLEISFEQELKRPFDLQRIARELANLVAVSTLKSLTSLMEALSVVYITRSVRPSLP